MVFPVSFALFAYGAYNAIPAPAGSANLFIFVIMVFFPRLLVFAFFGEDFLLFVTVFALAML